jgi:hypothetical protein
MKKILEEEIVARNSYVTTVRTRVSEFPTMTSFWLEVLETVKETGVNDVLIKVEEVQKATCRDYPVDCTSVQPLFHLQDIFMDEERRHMENEVNSSRIPESRNRFRV